MSDIQLYSLKASNFKKHESIDIVFSKGLTVIRGPNWAGKSSILHAILFALFGSSAVPGGAKKIPRRGAGKKQKTEVELVLHWATEYGVKIMRTMTTATVEVDGALVASGTSAVNEWVETSLLQLDQKRVMELAYSPQSETAALLTLGAPALNRRIEELSNADYIERLIVAAGKRVSTATAKLAGLGELDSVSMDDLLAERDQVKDAKERTDAKVAELEPAVETLKVTLNNLLDEIKHAEKYNEKVQEATQAKERLIELRSEMAEVQTLAEDTTVRNRLHNAKTAHEDLTALVNNLDRDTVMIKRSRDKELEILKWFDTTGAAWEVAELNVEPHAVAVKALAKLVSAEADAKAEFAARGSEHARLQTALSSSVCSECQRPLEDDPDHMAALQKQLAAASVAKQDADRMFAAASQAAGLKRAEVDKLAAALPPQGYEALAQAKKDELDAVQAEIDELAGRLENPAIADARERLIAAKAEAEAALVAMTRHNAAVTRLQQLQARVYTQSALVAEFGDQEAKPLHTLRDKHTVLHTQWSNQATVLSAAQIDQARQGAQLQSLEKGIESARQCEAQAKGYEKTIARFGGLQKWLRDSKSTFLAQAWAVVLGTASEFVRTATMGYASAVDRSEDGDFSVTEDGEQCSMTEVSGGMRAIASTGVRLGMGSVTQQGLGFVVLDEPSSELNDEHAAAMSGALRASGKQIILVTHREGDEFSSDKVVSLCG